MYKLLNTFAIAGLENIGYSDNSDNLVVLSSQGRGVFDCLNGQKIYRDELNWWQDYNKENNTVKGFGPENDKIIKVYGLHNQENLPLRTIDGWSLLLTEPTPDEPPFENYSIQSIFLNHSSLKDSVFITKDGPCEMRAFGFSDTGKSFVVALSCELTIWAQYYN